MGIYNEDGLWFFTLVSFVDKMAIGGDTTCLHFKEEGNYRKFSIKTFHDSVGGVGKGRFVFFDNSYGKNSVLCEILLADLAKVKEYIDFK